MNKHTSGSWVVAPTDPFRVCTHSGAGVAKALVYDKGHMPEALANARLIAAAPELLAALEFSYQRTAGRLTITEDFAIRDILAKAKGEISNEN